MAQIDVADKLAEIFALTWPYDTKVSLTVALTYYSQLLMPFCCCFVLCCVALCIEQRKADRFKCTKLIAAHRNFKSALESCSADEHPTAAKKKNNAAHLSQLQYVQRHRSWHMQRFDKIKSELRAPRHPLEIGCLLWAAC